MNKLTVSIACALMAASLSAAVATVQQIEPGIRPVYNSGTGVMPIGAQEAMPKAANQIRKDSVCGIGYSPIMLSLFTPVQFPGPDYDIGGVRLGLFQSSCVNFDGIDIGFVGISHGHANGWLACFACNIAYGDGVGLHTGIVNYMEGDFNGIEIGLANWIHSGSSFQLGLFNGVEDGTGCQIGVVNTAGKYQGVQIGLINLISYSTVPFFPIVNAWF